MKLTPEERHILDGGQSPVLQKVMTSVVQYGEMFDAVDLAEIEHNGHFVQSFGAGVLEPLYIMLKEIIDSGLTCERPFTVDPYPMDHKNVRSSLLEKLVFAIAYKKQKLLDRQLKSLGLKDDMAYTCACYLPEVGNIPKKGQILAWSESSAVAYVNSVIGARTNRNAGGIDILCNILGKTPRFDLLTDEGRKATWMIDVRTSSLPDPQLLGSAVGLTVMEDVPYVTGLDALLGKELTPETKSYLKDFGAAAASNGAVGLYHIENLTPEAVDMGRDILADNCQTHVIDDSELERIYRGYPLIWKDPNVKPKKCFIGCPHLSLEQIYRWTDLISSELNGKKTAVETILLSAPDVIAAFKKDTDAYNRLMKSGARLSHICPLMYMSNPLNTHKPVVTNSNKLRTYTSARFFMDRELLGIIRTGSIQEAN